MPSDYSLFTSYSFDPTKKKRDCYRDKNCMERFCKNLKEHVARRINYEQKEMIPLPMKKISLIKSRKFVTYGK